MNRKLQYTKGQAFLLDENRGRVFPPRTNFSSHFSPRLKNFLIRFPIWLVLINTAGIIFFYQESITLLLWLVLIVIVKGCIFFSRTDFAFILFHCWISTYIYFVRIISLILIVNPISQYSNLFNNGFWIIKQADQAT